MSLQPMILQLNIPFCFHRCSYCSLPSCRYDTNVLHAYAEAMVREINSAAPEYDDKEIAAISIEGGCPGLMAPTDLHNVLSTALKQFNTVDKPFISIQTMPGEYSRAMLDRMRDLGVNHWIFGIPTANESLHALLERPYNIDTLSMADTAIRNFPVRDLSFELHFGIPGQTQQDFLTDIDRCLSYKPEHMTLLPLRLEEGTKLCGRVSSGELSAVSRSDMADMYSAAAEKLINLGYRPYTNTDFALPGSENLYRIHKLKGTEQLGIGYMASSFVDSVHYTNGHSLQEYIDHPDEPELIISGLIMPDEKSLFIRDVSSALTLSDGLDLEALCRKHSSISTQCDVKATLSALHREGLLSINGSVMTLTPKGIAAPVEVFGKLSQI